MLEHSSELALVQSLYANSMRCPPSAAGISVRNEDLPMSFEEDAPPPCTCSAPSCLAGVEPLASESRFSLLDRRCFEHDFGIQPGFPPSGRKSVNGFERLNKLRFSNVIRIRQGCLVSKHATVVALNDLSAAAGRLGLDELPHRMAVRGSSSKDFIIPVWSTLLGC
ncbi:CUGBP Elav-like family member 2 [Dissostichus eleginoides]|uniref:CUGBP Elav-like family member 2 n=1 Tax=Dissostichus eleginoides TaxID=100907 RepID=A0AAD9F3Q6_DISEL|nr:CUGBP Elav-like family member 2 [Dissostichus eleginoides]